MSKIKVVGNAAVLSAGIELEALKKLTKFNPSALALVNEDGDELFSIKAGNTASISKFGIVFNETDADGYAQMTFLLPEGMDATKKVEFIKDTYAKTMLNLNELEVLLHCEMEQFNSAMTAVENSIEIL